MSLHDDLRDDLYGDYPPAPRPCDYCGEIAHFPNGVPEKETMSIMPNGHTIRPDVSIRSAAALVATLEVINTNLSDRALEAEQDIPNAFFFHVEGYFWCSPECYQWAHGTGPGSEGLRPYASSREKNQPQERVSPLPKCVLCGRLIIETAYPDIELFDWDAGDGPDCIECAVQHSDSQYKSPGECMNGVSTPADDVLSRFVALSEASFWAKVWCNRTKGLNQAWSDETDTQKALNAIQAHFDGGEWELGTEILASTGTPRWSADRDDTKTLYAWDPANCLRTAKAWIRLYEYRAGQMPSDLRKLIPDHHLEPCLEPLAECRLCGQSTKNARSKEHPYAICDACCEWQKEQERIAGLPWEQRRLEKWRVWKEGEEARIRRAENMLAELRDNARPDHQ